MRVRILAFATAATELGAGELELELPDGASLATLEAELVARHPGLGPLWRRLAVAVDGELAPPDAPLRDGVEVALLPPVSGGAGRQRARLVHEPLDAEALRRATGHPSCGAVVLFAGTARDHHRGRAVARLAYSAYERMAAASLETIARQLEAAAPGLRVGIVHRLGEVPIGEASVLIAAASPHRAAAFEAAGTALERLKREAPIWKRETYADGTTVWREEEPLVPRPGAAAAVPAGPAGA